MVWVMREKSGFTAAGGGLAKCWIARFRLFLAKFGVSVEDVTAFVLDDRQYHGAAGALYSTVAGHPSPIVEDRLDGANAWTPSSSARDGRRDREGFSRKARYYAPGDLPPSPWPNPPRTRSACCLCRVAYRAVWGAGSLCWRTGGDRRRRGAVDCGDRAERGGAPPPRNPATPMRRQSTSSGWSAEPGAGHGHSRIPGRRTCCASLAAWRAAASPGRRKRRWKPLRCLAGPVYVVKAQIHAGGRGAGRFAHDPNGKGGVRVWPSLEAVREAAAAMIGKTLITNWTGPASGCTASVEEGCDIARELYLSLLVDRQRAMAIASSEDGDE